MVKKVKKESLKDTEAKIKEAKRYREFLIKNGCTVENREMYTRFIDKENSRIILYKLESRDDKEIIYKTVDILKYITK